MQHIRQKRHKLQRKKLFFLKWFVLPCVRSRNVRSPRARRTFLIFFFLLSPLKHSFSFRRSCSFYFTFSFFLCLFLCEHRHRRGLCASVRTRARPGVCVCASGLWRWNGYSVWKLLGKWKQLNSQVNMICKTQNEICLPWVRYCGRASCTTHDDAACSPATRLSIIFRFFDRLLAVVRGFFRRKVSRAISQWLRSRSQSVGSKTKRETELRDSERMVGKCQESAGCLGECGKTGNVRWKDVNEWSDEKSNAISFIPAFLSSFGFIRSHLIFSLVFLLWLEPGVCTLKFPYGGKVITHTAHSARWKFLSSLLRSFERA